jgi:hypothetical protein
MGSMVEGQMGSSQPVGLEGRRLSSLGTARPGMHNVIKMISSVPIP